jgi:ACS family pantothenate transporter-like MFS transporter
LSLYGNQLNIMQTCWGVGYLLGGLPSNVLLTRVRPSILLPVVEVSKLMFLSHCVRYLD